ncbi:MAG: cytochrome c oxidase accessory protein CcoG, partial [Verrucomicrobiota bacterium]
MPAIQQPNLESLSSINRDGSRNFLHPADVKGNFTLWRRLFGGLLLSIYILLPWIPVGGYPAVFLDLAERRFHFFGLTFLTEDLWIGFFLLTGLGFSLFYITALFGRLWCGWACPYTVFLEHIYRRIERVIDGNAIRRRKLDAAPWTRPKIAKRILKHGLYLLVSLLIAHIFISYFISIPQLYEYMQQSPLHHAKAFGVMVFLTVCLYFSFSWFREQFCIILCPYGRIQSALTDDDTVIIGYDKQRGEPRGKVTDPGAGDCVGCNRCVQVCPTGIDIRNGLQLECIGCANCIDACNMIMDKVGRDRGLIRYDSLNGFEAKKRRVWRPRVALYTGLLCLGVVVLSFFISGLQSAKLEIIRLTGQPYYVDESGVRNQFRVQLVTKKTETTTFTLKAAGLPQGAVMIGASEPIEVEPGKEVMQTVFIQVPRKDYSG